MFFSISHAIAMMKLNFICCTERCVWEKSAMMKGSLLDKEKERLIYHNHIDWGDPIELQIKAEPLEDHSTGPFDELNKLYMEQVSAATFTNTFAINNAYDRFYFYYLAFFSFSCCSIEMQLM